MSVVKDMNCATQFVCWQYTLQYIHAALSTKYACTMLLNVHGAYLAQALHSIVCPPDLPHPDQSCQVWLGKGMLDAEENGTKQSTHSINTSDKERRAATQTDGIAHMVYVARGHMYPCCSVMTPLPGDCNKLVSFSKSLKHGQHEYPMCCLLHYPPTSTSYPSTHTANAVDASILKRNVARFKQAQCHLRSTWHPC